MIWPDDVLSLPTKFKCKRQPVIQVLLLSVGPRVSDRHAFRGIGLFVSQTFVWIA